jgi:curved DNA binding protein
VQEPALNHTWLRLWCQQRVTKANARQTTLWRTQILSPNTRSPPKSPRRSSRKFLVRCPLNSRLLYATVQGLELTTVGWIAADASIVELCERGDKLLDEEIAKVYKGKKVIKGIGHCCTISPSAYVTPYTPLKTDAEESTTSLKEGEVVKIQLGAQIDGFCAIVCDNVIVGSSEEVTGREADLILATHYANELLLRLMVPPGLVAHGDEEEQKKASSKKPYTQSQITNMLEKITKAYGCNVVESTTIWQFEHNEIESKKKIILAPGEGTRGEGLPEVGEVWGVEMGVSLGSGKVKSNGNRTTLHRRTALTYQLKRPTSRGLLSEVVKKFGTFPFSLRQLDDEKTAKVGVVECVRTGVIRQYEVVVDKDAQPVARVFSTVGEFMDSPAHITALVARFWPDTVMCLATKSAAAH